MTENTEALIAEARREASIHDKLGDGFGEGSEERAFYYGHRDRYKRLADALEAVTRERDAALAAIERVREIHERDMVLRDYCSECSDFGSDQFPPGQMVEWPCPTVAALDGAPEPEGEWEYGAKVDNSGRVVRIEDSPGKVRLGKSATSYANPQWVDDVLVRRRKAGPWLPVGGESK